MNIYLRVKKTKFNRCFKHRSFIGERMLSVFLLLFLVQIFVIQKVNAQDKKVTVHMVNEPLAKVLNELTKQTNYKFFYSDNDTDENQLVTLSLVNKPLIEVLKQLFKGKNIGFQLKNGQILLFKKNEPKPGLATAEQSSNLIKVTGKVTDENGQVLPGVTVINKGTNSSTIADVNGNYSFENVPSNATLVFSFIGMQSQEVSVDNQSKINVGLSETSNSLNEVVVLGFGTQKKLNVTGAISTVSGADLVNRPVSNISSLLVGSTTGVSGLQVSGEPGQNGTQIFIRGQGTSTNSQPLIVIDGVEQPEEQAYSELNGMDPNEIAGISVLKDAASTAVYGIRGANGVIIVTTKTGKIGKPVFNLSVNYGSTQAVNLLKQASSYEWASTRNNAIQTSANDFGDKSYSAYLISPDQLWKLQNNRDFTPAEVADMTGLTDAQRAQLNASPALYYRNTDLMNQLFGNSAPQKQVNFNVSGGNDRVKYYTSLGYFTQNGIGVSMSYGGAQTGSSYDRYNFKSNFDIQLNKNTKVLLNLAGQFGTTHSTGAYSTSTGAILATGDLGSRYLMLSQYVMEGNPLNFNGQIDGKLITGAGGIAGGFGNPLGLQGIYTPGNAIVQMFNSGMGTTINTLSDNSIKLVHTLDYLTKGLSVHATADYQYNYTKFVSQTYSVPYYSVQRDFTDPNKMDFYGGATGYNSFNNDIKYNSTWSKTYFDAGIDYDRTFGSHKITALLLGRASQYNMPGDIFNTPSGLMGLVGRMTYNYKEKYLLEYDLGFNGTAQFAANQRFGYFPAYSVGWVPTNETFFKENKLVTFLKIRASYGEVGNDLLGSRRFLYLPNSYNMNLGNSGNNQGYYLGSTDGSTSSAYYQGASEGALGNPYITWEKAKKLDIGLDARFLSDRFSITADYFHDDRSNILTNSGIIPLTLGVSGSNTAPVNIGVTVNSGYELSLGWKDKIGEVGYFVNAGVSYAKNKVLFQAEAPNPYSWMNHTGFPIGQYYGLVNDGFFNTSQELANRPYNTYTSNVATLGDIRYKDLNGDGKVDNKDIGAIGYSNLPQYHFNATVGINFKGFDASVLFIGTANGSYALNLSSGSYVVPYWQGTSNLWQWQNDGQWTAAKAASGAKITFPRPIMFGSSTSNSYLMSDFWLISNNYLRIKNLEIGYTLPVALTKHLLINSLRLYFNASNLFTFKNALSMYGVDPEQTDTGATFLYPLTKVINFGLKAQF